MPKVFKNMTGYEIDTLAETYNLTDGHAFRPWSPLETEIINHSAQLFKKNNRQMQAQLEADYIRDFLSLGKQTLNTEEVGYLMVFTASMAFEMVANYLRLNNLTMSLISLSGASTVATDTAGVILMDGSRQALVGHCARARHQSNKQYDSLDSAGRYLCRWCLLL